MSLNPETCPRGILRTGTSDPNDDVKTVRFRLPIGTIYTRLTFLATLREGEKHPTARVPLPLLTSENFPGLVSHKPSKQEVECRMIWGAVVSSRKPAAPSNPLKSS